MSLTSYRAAPPRVTMFLPKAKYRSSKARALCGLLPEQLGEAELSPVRDAPICGAPIFSLHRDPKAKGRFASGPCYRLWAVEFVKRRYSRVAFSRPGSDRLSRVLRRSTIGAGAFHGRVRKGNGCSHPAMTTRSAKRNLRVRSWRCFHIFFEHVFSIIRLPDERFTFAG